MQIGSIKIHWVTEPMFGENAYLLHLDGRSDCLVCDPSFEGEAILEYLRGEGLTPAAILNTHGHADHIAGNAYCKAEWPDAPLLIGEGDAVMLTDPIRNLSRPFGLDIVSPPAEQTLNEGDQLALAGFTLDVLDTPGHSPGHIVFVIRQEDPVVVLGGDVLFRAGIGRTDFPGGDFEQLASSIRDKLYRLPDTSLILPGHGPPTTVGDEKQHNPFVPGM